ncbi:putative DNA repair helicase [Trypanosoma conorhini]|uniref:Putative DNA repair helicase n=1 Tax=Trypanosoma conorhini TaxID=83891 RepID=A0A3R7P052_9TRYP|nr:putative DNA repair helicase [Trypanosoma conorhini]RNF14923.1 putative DNA repair helicase [Trypanosoma conorhini]
MYDAGRFRVPFPFDPYPLQLHAMEAIRGGLAAGDVVVLESPTGTGKTQVLLNGVLSHVFEPIVAVGSDGTPPPLQQQQNASPPETAALAPPLAGAVGGGHKRRRKEKKAAKQHMRVSAREDEADAFLLDQNEAAAAAERRREFAMAQSSSSSSSSNSSSMVAVDDAEEEDGEEWEPPLSALQKPKVYFSSRTHTQLQQLTEELRRTVFARHPIRSRHRRRRHLVIAGEPNEEAVESALDDTPHMLRYVHVAGRQQLCINAALRAAAGNNNDRLNELCLEAMMYEYSKEGRAARKQHEMRGKGSVLTDIEDNVSAGGMPKGCGYCRRERLKILRDYVEIAPRGLLEMREIGQRIGACPFLATRELLRGADVVLIPYSYLVSPEMRHTLLSGTATNAYETAAKMEEAKSDGELDATAHPAASHLHRTMALKQDAILPPNFSGDVIAVDEAHNLVDFCRNATASTVSTADLSLVRRLLDGYYSRYEKRLLTRNKQRIREMVSFLDNLLTYLNMNSVGKTNSGAAADVYNFSSFVFDANVDNVNVYRFLAFLSESRLLPKLHGLVAFLALQEKETPGQERRLLTVSRRSGRNSGVSQAAGSEEARGEATDSSPLAAGQDPRSVTGALHRFDAFLRWYSRSDEYTRVLLRRAPVEQAREPADVVTLQLLQLEPGTHTLFPLLQQVQAAVLAGGTMKPLALTCDLLLRSPNPHPPPPAYMQEEDKMDSMTKLEREPGDALTGKKVCFTEEAHIVPSSSIAVFTLGVGPSGHRVELQHATRTQWNRQLEEIAAALLNFCRVIPDGVIVFFTSYEMEENFLGVLQRTGLYDAINEVKRIFREPGRVAPSRLPAQSGEEGASASNAVEAMLAEYTRWIRTESSGGALLFAVMGGKLSEGINFNDDLGRAVIVVGLPYANPSDVELQLYLSHVANTRLLRDSAAAGSKTLALDAVRNEGSPPFTSSAEWSLFTDLCIRTVNQSMGRCIRHAADYAVVILFDARYGERPDVRRRIASWMQPSIRVAHNFGECFRGVRDFFTALQRNNVAS